MTIFLENKYTKYYLSIITNAKAESRVKSTGLYFERHHVIPQSLGGDNSESNLVLLTYKEHFICHWLLTKMCISVNHTAKMQKAFFKMTVTNKLQKRHVSSRYVEIAKRNASDAQLKLWQDPEFRRLHQESTSTEEYKRIKAEQGRKNWLDDDYRYRVLSKLKETNLKPEIREKRSRASKESQNRPEVKEKNRQGVIKYWQDPAMRQRQSERLKIACNKPEARARNSQAQLRPDVIAKKKSSMARVNADPITKAKRSKAALEVARRPGQKELKSEITKRINLGRQMTCPHCGKTCGPSNAYRWHFDKCRSKQ